MHLTVTIFPTLYLTLARAKKRKSPHLSSSYSVSWVTKATSTQTGSQFLGFLRDCSQEGRGGVPRKTVIRKRDSPWPYNLEQEENSPSVLPRPAQLIQEQGVCFYWPASLWFKFQTAQGFILLLPPLKANHYGFCRRSPQLTHYICTIFA